MVGFTSLHHFTHELHGVRVDAEVGKARRKACHAQDAHRVFAKSFGHMAQYFGLQISLAVVRVKNVTSARPVCGSSYGIDSEVTPCQVFFQRDIGRGVHHKATVAHTALALGAGQRVFLVGLGVQKDGEVFAHGRKAARGHGFGCRANDHPVGVMKRTLQQAVAHGTADLVNLHAVKCRRAQRVAFPGC